MAAAVVPLVVGLGGALIGGLLGKTFSPKPVAPPQLTTFAAPPAAPGLAPIKAKAEEKAVDVAQVEEQRARRRAAQSSSSTAIKALSDDFTAGVKVKSLLGD